LAAIGDPQTFREEPLKSFVFENADFYIQTLAGHGTFHSMGGIKCATPASRDKPLVDIEPTRGQMYL